MSKKSWVGTSDDIIFFAAKSAIFTLAFGVYLRSSFFSILVIFGTSNSAIIELKIESVGVIGLVI